MELYDQQSGVKICDSCPQFAQLPSECFNPVAVYLHALLLSSSASLMRRCPLLRHHSCIPAFFFSTTRASLHSSSASLMHCCVLLQHHSLLSRGLLATAGLVLTRPMKNKLALAFAVLDDRCQSVVECLRLQLEKCIDNNQSCSCRGALE